MDTKPQQQLADLIPPIKEQCQRIATGAAERMSIAASEGRGADVGTIYREAYAKQADVLVNALLDDAIATLVNDTARRVVAAALAEMKKPGRHC